MINKFLRSLILFLAALVISVNAQDKVLKVWPNKIPGSIENANYKEKSDTAANGMVTLSKVTDPTISVYFPHDVKATGAAVVICPGGGYVHLAYTKEGINIAHWLNSLGVTGVVLKYRLPSDEIMKDKTIGPLQDAQEAMRIVRRNAKEWGLDPNKIGLIGFSAGGSLASTLCTHYNMKVYDSDSTSARPDFAILGYPVISMKLVITHLGSRENLLGKNPSQKTVEEFSNELQVNENTPETFLFQAEDDHTVPVENSIDYFLALKKYKIPAELHIYEKGGHGFGLGYEGETNSDWPKACAHWLKQIGML
jgi:acetyl esterase/lipase